MYEARLAAHYQLPYINTCEAFRTSLRNHTYSRPELCRDMPDADAKSSVLDMRAPRTMKDQRQRDARYFASDPLHYGRRGEQLQACLMASAVLGEPSGSAAAAAHEVFDGGLPPALGDAAGVGLHLAFVAGKNASGAVPCFAASAKAGTLRAAEGSSSIGWVEQKGGRGGQKKWLRVSKEGQEFVFVAPRPSNVFKVEVYTHHSLPLGRVRVIVEEAGNADDAGDAGDARSSSSSTKKGVGHSRVHGKKARTAPNEDDEGNTITGSSSPRKILSETFIEPCCPATGCGAGIPRGNGVNKEFRVPATGRLPAAAKYRLRISVVPRTKLSGPSPCSTSGSQTNLIGIVGFAMK